MVKWFGSDCIILLVVTTLLVIVDAVGLLNFPMINGITKVFLN